MSKRYSQKQAAARVVREQLAREQRRRRQMWTSLFVVAALVVVGAAGYLIYTSQRGGDYKTPPSTYKNNVGFVVGSGPKLVEIYLDYQCPICRNFESQVKDTTDQLLAANKIKMVYYTVAILDGSSKNDYSTRAAAASACAAEGGKFPEYNNALFANQPAENTAGPADSELIATGRTVGLGDSFATCVKDGKYTSWTKHVTDTFEARKLTGTPSVFVDGKQLSNPTLAAFTTAIGASQ